MCEFCECKNPLDDIADQWLFEEDVDLGVAAVSFGGVICPKKKQLDITVVPTPIIHRELLSKRIDINYCPICGRELLKGDEIMTLERFLGMYDGNCAISVVRGDEQLCAVQALEEIKGDEWFMECKASEVTAFKIVPDEYEKDAVVLLITVK